MVKNILAKVSIILMLCSQLSVAVSADVKKEVQILINGSARTAKKDVNEKRLLILKELIKVFPEHGKLGVFAFAKQSKVLIPFAEFTPKLINKIDQIKTAINTRDKNANLGEALEIVTTQWTEPAEYKNIRKLILLTDGFMQVEDGERENSEAEAHILNSLLPQFIRNKIQIHILGIDKPLNEVFLRTLAEKTQGSYQSIDQLENVSWSLLKILDQEIKISPEKFEILPAKATPIEENNFTVSELIDELSLIITKKTTESLLVLKDPNGKVIDKNAKNKRVEWHSEQNTDLITIKKPRIGKWTIIGDLNPNKKFEVLDTLDIEVTTLPADVFVGESFMVTASLINNDKFLPYSRFIKGIEFSVDVDPSRSMVEPYYFNDNEKDGSYTFQLGPFDKVFPEPITVSISMIGKTFTRTKQQTINILPIPVTVKTDVKVDKDGQIINVEAFPDPEILDQNNINLTISLTDVDGKTTTHNMKNIDDRWLFSFIPNNISSYNAKIEVVGETVLGRYVELKTDPLTIMVPNVTLPESVVIKVSAEPIADVQGEIVQELPMPIENTQNEFEIVYFIIGLLLSLLIIWLVIRLLNKFNTKYYEEIEKCFTTLGE